MNENILIIRGEEHLNLHNQLLINHVIIASCALFILSVWEKGEMTHVCDGGSLATQSLNPVWLLRPHGL